MDGVIIVPILQTHRAGITADINNRSGVLLADGCVGQDIDG